MELENGKHTGETPSNEMEKMFAPQLEHFTSTLEERFRREGLIKSGGAASSKKINLNQLSEFTDKVKIDTSIETEEVNPNETTTDQDNYELENLQDFRNLVNQVCNILKINEASFNKSMLKLAAMQIFRSNSAPIWNILKEELESPNYVFDRDNGQEIINKLKTYRINTLSYIYDLLEFLAYNKVKEHFKHYQFQHSIDFDSPSLNKIDFLGKSCALSYPDLIFDVKYRKKNVNVVRDVIFNAVERLREYNNLTKKENCFIQVIFTEEKPGDFEKVTLRFKKSIEGDFPEYVNRIIYLPISIGNLGNMDIVIEKLQVIIDDLKNQTKLVFIEKPAIIVNNDNIRIQSDFITKPIGSFAAWVRVPPIKEISSQTVNNRYLAAHDTAGGRKVNDVYLNAWSIALTPKDFKLDVNNTLKWKFWISNEKGESFMSTSDELNNEQSEWYHVLIRWNHNKPLLEFWINGKLSNTDSNYLEFWPKNFEKIVKLGNWTKPNLDWNLNVPIFRVVATDSYLSDLWLNDEIKKSKDKLPNYDTVNSLKPLEASSEKSHEVLNFKIEYADRFLIHSAKYGFGQQFTDVTIKLREMIQKNNTFFTINNQLLGDPHIGMNKLLIINYGDNKELQIPENGVLDTRNYVTL